MINTLLYSCAVSGKLIVTSHSGGFFFDLLVTTESNIPRKLRLFKSNTRYAVRSQQV